MKERPILFSAPMVRAILDGAKTQTRRVVTVPWHKSTRCLPYEPYWVDDDGVLRFCDEYGDYHEATRCMAPYGAPGDRLWVRETHKVVPASAYRCSREDDGSLVPHRVSPDGTEWAIFREGWTRSPGGLAWKPSIFMRRWASRITLAVTSVRIERLQKITDSDARAEGVVLGKPFPCRVNGEPGVVAIYDPIKAYAVLWDAINGERQGCAWSDNPWVWVVEFQRIEEEKRSHAAE